MEFHEKLRLYLEQHQEWFREKLQPYFPGTSGLRVTERDRIRRLYIIRGICRSNGHFFHHIITFETMTVIFNNERVVIPEHPRGNDAVEPYDVNADGIVRDIMDTPQNTVDAIYEDVAKNKEIQVCVGNDKNNRLPLIYSKESIWLRMDDKDIIRIDNDGTIEIYKQPHPQPPQQQRIIRLD